MNHTFAFLRGVSCMVLWAALQTTCALAQPFDNLIFTAGTTTADAQNRQWSYLLWQAGDPALLNNRVIAIYAKPGDANSPSLYERKAIVRLTTEPGVIDVLITRALNLGEAPAVLEERLNTLFQKLMPPGGTTLAEKISIVIRSSQEPEQFKRLLLLSRQHPALSFSLGLAYAEIIPNAGKVTYEIRQFDLANNADISVVGRVTVEAGAPTILPTPGAPVHVPDVPVTSAKGDLNAKFRWADPDNLRRLALMSFGYNLYRVTPQFAVAQNFHNVPPGLGVLAQLALQFSSDPTNPPVKRVNNRPILKGKDFSLVDVANFDTNSPSGDATTYFAHDDNDRYKPGSVPFQNGDTFYYFVTARDILGRDGLTSPGTLVLMCDRLAPEAPRSVVVENDYSKAPNTPPQQVLKVSWKQNTNTANETHTFYYVYRWTNHSDSLKDNIDPVANPHRVSGPIPHVPGQERLTFVDSGVGSPHMPEDAGKTFWYTVRVQDNGACGGNFSPHTGPAFGVLRDRTGPDAPNGAVSIVCCEPAVAPDRDNEVPLSNSDDSRAYFRPACDRLSKEIEWAEFYAFNTAQSNFIDRVYFVGTGPARAEVSWARSQLVNTQITFYCRIGSVDGKISGFTSLSVRPPKPDFAQHVGFRADFNCRRIIAHPSGTDRCNGHVSNPPGTLGTNNCVDLLLLLADGTKEIKLYKRVDYGPLMLIEQSKATNSQFTFEDCVPVANPAEVCYFAQAYDEHGNASALVPIGPCIPVGGATPIATPILSPLTPSGSAANPRMDITWFCPPYGIARFEVSVAIEGDATAPIQISSMLSDQVRVDSGVDFTLQGEQKQDDFAVYNTKLVGSSFGDGAKFSVRVAVELGKTYYVYVRAIGKDDSLSKRSNVEDFTWSEPPTPGPQVPWPDRPLPPVQPIFDTKLAATNLNNALYPVGIRIGTELPVVAFTEPTNGNAMLQGFTTPLKFLLTKKSGDTVLPVAVYRYQVPSAKFPKVSGDLTQVSPLMEKIAFQQTNVAPYGNVTIIHDPFVLVMPRPRTSGSPLFDLYLVDTQPVINGARYAYLLVRFGENREIEEVIPTNEVQL